MSSALKRLVRSLEVAPPLLDWQFEAEVQNLSADSGVVMGIPLIATRVRVRQDCGDEFWEALADLYEEETP